MAWHNTQPVLFLTHHGSMVAAVSNQQHCHLRVFFVCSLAGKMSGGRNHSHNNSQNLLSELAQPEVTLNKDQVHNLQFL